MNAGVTPTIDYDELVRAYHESLTTVLRGFKAGDAFLDLWVPDDDHHQSILNLVESAESAGLNAIIIRIGATTRNTLDPTRLFRILDHFGTTHVTVEGDAIFLEVRYARVRSE